MDFEILIQAIITERDQDFLNLAQMSLNDAQIIFPFSSLLRLVFLSKQ
jgi:hypothetical protein